MAATILATQNAPLAASGALRRYGRGALQSVRQNLVPWLAVKATLSALVVVGMMGFWTAFVADSAVSVLVVAYGWVLARR